MFLGSTAMLFTRLTFGVRAGYLVMDILALCSISMRFRLRVDIGEHSVVMCTLLGRKIFERPCIVRLVRTELPLGFADERIGIKSAIRGRESTVPLIWFSTVIRETMVADIRVALNRAADD